MLVNQIQEKIIRSEEFAEQSFKIKASAKAFKILSSQLYKNKIAAIIRELSCNACDSHIAAGHPYKPFTIHIPTRYNNTFSIRDFGTGLSREDVETIYTTYFESTKTNSNDFIGCLGLGSKTPFSYTDTFIINSFFNGKKFIYNAFLNEIGLPSVALMSEIDTDEPNGLSVSFAVKAEDFELFAQNAKEILKWFSFAPVIEGNKIEIPKITKIDKYEGNDWFILKQSPQQYNYTYSPHCDNQATTVYALMGNIAYPIDWSQIDQQYNNLKQSRLVLRFKLGELDIAASREELSYDKTTIQRINNKFEKVLKDIEDLSKNCLDTAESYISAVHILNDFQKSSCLFNKVEASYNSRKVYSILNYSHHWPSFGIKTCVLGSSYIRRKKKTYIRTEFPQITEGYTQINFLAGAQLVNSTWNIQKLTNEYSFRNNIFLGVKSQPTGSNLTAKEIDDFEEKEHRSFIRKLKNFIREKIDLKASEEEKSIYCIIFETEKHRDDFVSYVEMKSSDFLLLENINPPKPRNSPGSSRKRTEVKMYKVLHGHSSLNEWDGGYQEVDFNDTFPFIERTGYNPTNAIGSVALKAALNLGMIPDKIITLTPQQLTKITPGKHIPVKEYVKEKFEEFIKQNEERLKIYYSDCVNWSDSEKYKLNFILSLEPYLNQSKVPNLIDKIKLMKSYIEIMNEFNDKQYNLNELFQIFSIPIPKNPINQTLLLGNIFQLVERYKMIKIIFDRRLGLLDQEIEELANYINVLGE